jgi:hypothetical protein
MYKNYYGITTTEYKGIEMITFANIDKELKKYVDKNEELIEELKNRYQDLFKKIKKRMRS